MCEGLHYALVAQHIRIQAAAAYAMLGKQAEAEALLTQALRDAQPDGLVMPFVENYRYLSALLPRCGGDAAFRAQIAALGEAYEARCGQLQARTRRPAAFAALTDRELEIVRLVAAAPEQPGDR